MKTQPKMVLLATAVATLSPLGTDAAQAQSTESGITDIVVTARRREERLQNVPISVTVLTAEALRNQSVQSVRDIQFQTPSLTIAPTNSDRNNLSVTIRGQNVSDPLLAVDPAIGIYIDGVNFAKTLGTELASLADVERVEVLKGPQGTLFGRNTTGGALSITSKLPTDHFEGQIFIRTDEYARLGGTAIVNLPLDGDNLALRLVGSYDRRDAFGQNLLSFSKAGGDLNGGAIRGTLLWRPSDKVDVIVRGDYSKSSTSSSAWKARYLGPGPGVSGLSATEIVLEGGATTPAGAYDAYIADGNTDSFWDVVNSTQKSHSRVVSWGGSSTVNVDFGDVAQLKSITSYRRLTRDTLMDQDGSRFLLLEVNGLTSQRLFAQELSLTGQLLDNKLDWIVGGFFSRETGTDGTRARSIQRIANFARSTNDGDVVNRSIAAFGQFTWHFAERFGFTGGLRYTKDTKSLLSRNRAVSGAGVESCNVPRPTSTSPCELFLKNSWDALAYTAVLDFKPTDDVLVYIKNSRGYRSGGFNMRGTSNPVTFEPFAPEQVTDYEIGLKADLFDRHVRLNLAAYRSNYNDIQRSVVIPTDRPPFTTTVVRNAAKARINGVEAELTIKPTDELTLRATGALTDARYLKFVSGGVDVSSLKFGTTPKYTYTVSAGYDIPINGGPAHIQVDWAWQDDIYWFPDSRYNGLNETPDLRGQDAYGLLNARISKTFDREGVDVALFVRNALNRKYYVQGLDLSGALGFNSGIPGDPRVIGAEASFKF